MEERCFYLQIELLLVKSKIQPMSKIKNLCAFLLLIPSICFLQKFEGLALTPPMGWNSWNTFGVDMNEDVNRY